MFHVLRAQSSAKEIAMLLHYYTTYNKTEMPECGSSLEMCIKTCHSIMNGLTNMINICWGDTTHVYTTTVQ